MTFPFPILDLNVGYSANAVRFDGTNDWLNRGAAWTGAADSKNMILSFWIKMIGADGGLNFIFGDDNTYAERVEVQRLAANTLEISTRATSGGTYVQRFVTTNTILIADGWTHVLASFDALNTTQQVYIDDVAETASASTNLNALMDFTMAEWLLGKGTLGNYTNAEIADFYFAPSQYLDFSVTANRRKFIDGAGKPVDLGVDGSTPTGVAPIEFQSGDTSTWHTNLGGGGGMTENGALTTASTSPSD
jgi:hypothetical protein